MRLYADEDFPRAVVEELRRLGLACEFIELRCSRISMRTSVSAQTGQSQHQSRHPAGSSPGTRRQLGDLADAMAARPVGRWVNDERHEWPEFLKPVG